MVACGTMPGMTTEGEVQQVFLSAVWTGKAQSAWAHCPAVLTIRNEGDTPCKVADIRFEHPKLGPRGGDDDPLNQWIQHAPLVIGAGETYTAEIVVHVLAPSVGSRPTDVKMSLAFQDSHGHWWRRWSEPYNWFAPNEPWA